MPNFANRTLYHGDNLDFLRGMNSGTVALVATDPPFNKARDFHATPDSLAKGASFQDRWSWRDDVHDDWLDAIQKDEPEVWQVISTAKAVYGDDMGAFLCWLGVRLLEVHRVLRDDGSLYLHIDHTAHAWVKCLLDAVFGKENFQNEIVWGYEKPRSSSKVWRRNHDTLLFYSRSNQWTFTPQRMPTLDGRFELRKPFKRPDGTVWEPKEPGKQAGDWWYDIPSFATRMTAKERTGYPTQKPVALYERIVAASSNPGDLVLDPFCGCATTLVAAERLDRQWVGMDIWAGAHQLVIDRLQAEGHDAPIIYTTTPPVRTDRAETAAPVFSTPTSRTPRRHPPPRTQHAALLIDIGPFCQGCGQNYGFDPRVLEVDHIRPKSDGGSDAYDNLTLLCPPCNREKRDRMTLTGLQVANTKSGHMIIENANNIRHGRGGTSTRKRR